MAMAGTFTGVALAVVERKWEAYTGRDGASRQGGHVVTLWIGGDFDEEPLGVFIPDRNGWRSALQAVKFGDAITVELAARGNGNSVRYEVRDLKIGKPAGLSKVV